MKEELNGKLVEILTSIQTATGKVADFALEQLPDIAQSYIAYGRVHGTVMLAIMVIAFVLFSRSFVANFKKANDGGDGTPELMFLSMIFCGFGLIITAISALSMIGGVFLVWIAPKVWLLKELASMVK